MTILALTRELCHQKLENLSDMAQIADLNLIHREYFELTTFKLAEVCKVSPSQNFVKIGPWSRYIYLTFDYIIFCRQGPLRRSLNNPRQPDTSTDTSKSHNRRNVIQRVVKRAQHRAGVRHNQVRANLPH